MGVRRTREATFAGRVAAQTNKNDEQQYLCDAGNNYNNNNNSL